MNKRLYRSRREKMIGGVCGGLADYFNIDPVIMRVLFVVLTLGPLNWFVDVYFIVDYCS